MRILVTGAGGFLGRRLTRMLLAEAALGRADHITELVLTDLVELDAASTSLPVRMETGNLSDPYFCRYLAEQHFDSIFHLAASLTLDAERDQDAAFALNVTAVRCLLARQACWRPRVVYASSLAVFGGILPQIVDDDVRPRPATTYGSHKAMVELMLADMTRRGDIDARCLRLPIVLVRPSSPTAAVSDKIAAIIREPLAGRDVECPLAGDTVIPIASAGAVCRALIALHAALPEALPVDRAINLPALSASIADIAAAVSASGGSRIGRIQLAPDPALQAIVAGWPRRLVSSAASALGLRADVSVEQVIADHLDQAEEAQDGRR